MKANYGQKLKDKELDDHTRKLLKQFLFVANAEFGWGPKYMQRFLQSWTNWVLDGQHADNDTMLKIDAALSAKSDVVDLIGHEPLLDQNGRNALRKVRG